MTDYLIKLTPVDNDTFIFNAINNSSEYTGVIDLVNESITFSTIDCLSSDNLISSLIADIVNVAKDQIK